MGFEYMLFDEALRDRFLAFVTAHGIDSTMRPDEIASGLGSPRAAMHALRYYWQTPDLISTLREKKRR